MIYEFAVEPELIFEWARERGDGAYFADAFGLGRPRILAIYPKEWRTLVTQHAADEYKRLKETAESAEQRGRLDTWYKRFEVLWRKLVTENKTIGRGYLPHPEKEWLANAKQHVPDPFHAILARTPISGSEHVLAGDDITDSPRWRFETSCSVARNPREIAALVAPLLKRCGRIIFVDPHWRPQSSDHLAVLSALLALFESRTGTSAPAIAIVASDDKGKRDWASFEAECHRKRIGNALPAGWNLRVHKIKEKSGGQKIHNRYVLTDIGGLQFGTGLDADSAGMTDDVSLMDRKLYELRWKQYSPGSDAFDWDSNAQFTILGTKRP